MNLDPLSRDSEQDEIDIRCFPATRHHFYDDYLEGSSAGHLPRRHRGTGFELSTVRRVMARRRLIRGSARVS